MKKLTVASVICATALLPIHAHAADEGDRGFYYGVEGTFARFGVSESDISRRYGVLNEAETSVDNQDFGYAVFAGFRFWKYLAIDGGLFDFGTARFNIGNHTGLNCNTGTGTVTCITVIRPPLSGDADDASGVRFRATGSWPIGSAWTADGRLGIALIGGGDAVSGQAMWGIGATRKFRNSFRLRVFHDRLVNEQSGTSGVSVLSLGLSYQF